MDTKINQSFIATLVVHYLYNVFYRLKVLDPGLDSGSQLFETMDNITHYNDFWSKYLMIVLMLVIIKARNLLICMLFCLKDMFLSNLMLNLTYFSLILRKMLFLILFTNIWVSLFWLLDFKLFLKICLKLKCLKLYQKCLKSRFPYI